MKKSICTIILAFLSVGYSFGQKETAIVSGKINSFQDGDKVNITVSEFGYPLNMLDQEYSCILINHSFHLTIPISDHPIHISFRYALQMPKPHEANTLSHLGLSNFILEKGDRIHIAETNGVYHFNGKGSNKFRLVAQLKKVAEKYQGSFGFDNPEYIVTRCKKQDSSYTEKIELIEHNKNQMSANVFNLLKADALGDLYSGCNGFVLMTDSQIRLAVAKLSNYESSVPNKYLSLREFNKNDILKYSSAYTNDCLPEKYMIDSCYKLNKRFKLENYFNYVMDSYKGGLRERLLMNILIPQLDSSANIIPLVNTALRVIVLPQFKNLLYEFKQRRQPGAEAFDFMLPDTSGKMIHFSNFKGKVVLLDFWFTGCGSCLAAKPYLEKVEQGFKGQPVVFITISNDKDRSTWIKTIRSHRYTSSFGIDLFTEGLAFRHPISKYYNIDGGPYFILIDKTGHLTVNPEDPRYDGGAQMTALINKELDNNK
jgi:thiol-disulfide isomerase/thioredoxin